MLFLFYLGTGHGPCVSSIALSVREDTQGGAVFSMDKL